MEDVLDLFFCVLRLIKSSPELYFLTQNFAKLHALRRHDTYIYIYIYIYITYIYIYLNMYAMGMLLVPCYTEDISIYLQAKKKKCLM